MEIFKMFASRSKLEHSASLLLRQQFITTRAFEAMMLQASNFYLGTALPPPPSLHKAAQNFIDNWIEFINDLDPVMSAGDIHLFEILPEKLREIQNAMGSLSQLLQSRSLAGLFPQGTIRKLIRESESLRKESLLILRATKRNKSTDYTEIMQKLKDLLGSVSTFFGTRITKVSMASSEVMRLKLGLVVVVKECSEIVEAIDQFDAGAQIIMDALFQTNDAFSEFFNQIKYPFNVSLVMDDQPKHEEEEEEEDQDRIEMDRMAMESRGKIDSIRVKANEMDDALVKGKELILGTPLKQPLR